MRLRHIKLMLDSAKLLAGIGFILTLLGLIFSIDFLWQLGVFCMAPIIFLFIWSL